jgi:hypothetical protein
LWRSWLNVYEVALLQLKRLTTVFGGVAISSLWRNDENDIQYVFMKYLPVMQWRLSMWLSLEILIYDDYFWLLMKAL